MADWSSSEAFLKIMIFWNYKGKTTALIDKSALKNEQSDQDGYD